MTNKSERLIDARNGCYGNEEATGDDGVLEEFGDDQPTKGVAHADGTGAVANRKPSINNVTEAHCGSADESAIPALKAEIQGQVIPYDGNLLPAMTAMVTGFVDKLAKFYSPCPQGDDCAGDQKHDRIFACDHCSFIGCAPCLDRHEAEPHWSDGDTVREMHS